MAITATQLSKRFNLYERPWHRFKEWMTLGRVNCHRPFWALRDVNLHIPRGTAVGIVGPNGAGKSTLLKIITGTLFPSEGQVEVEGRVAGLLELGTGFHPEFTGRLNIYLNGKMLGLNDEEIEERFADIVAFSELDRFIDQPLRTYSSGMAMRLGFAIASCVDPDILIIDEVLSVGDAHFSQKCVRRIRRFREEGATILFVSHDPGAVLALCDQAILLENGAIRGTGTPEEVLDLYNARLAERGTGGSRIVAKPKSGASLRSGNFRAVITAVEFRNARGEISETFAAGEETQLTVRLVFLVDVADPTVGILIRSRLGIEVFGTNTRGLGRSLGDFRAGDALDVSFSIPLNLGPGEYTLTVAAHLDESHVAGNFDWIDKACQFQIAPSTDFRFHGLAKLTPQVNSLETPQREGEVEKTLLSIFDEPVEVLDGRSDSDLFFLEGWTLEQNEKRADRSRALEGEGRFVFRLRGEGIEVVAADEGDVDLHLKWLSESFEGVRDGNVWRFALPADVRDRLRIFSLSAAGGDFRVLEIRSYGGRI
ncbi:ABC transporter ATP-binding protein [bacterium]|nr:ABC transporter ATP-binding protein [bacterium]